MSTPSAPATPAKTEKVRIKGPVTGTPLFGCEHVQRLFGAGSGLTGGQEATTAASTANGSGGLAACVQHYKSILRCIFDNVPLIAQTTRGPEGQAITSLTSNYLCLQCPTIVSEDDRIKHGSNKQHRFYVESRNGTLYCQMCDDFVWDPTLEELRIRKMGTGSFSVRKRKHDEIAAEAAKEDVRFIVTNTMTPPCRVNGLRGIYNAGATCYQNVVLQTFLHNPLIRNFYLTDGHTSGNCSGVPHCLSCAMDDMFQDFWGVENTNGYTAANILSGFWISEKKAFENLVTTKEQDAHEFFQFLAEELHERNSEALANKDKSSEDGSTDSSSAAPAPTPVSAAPDHTCKCIIHQTFYGRLQTTTTCQHCSGVTNTSQMFLDLNLGVESLAHKRSKKDGKKAMMLTLQECLDEEYLKSDKCEYRCTACDSQQQARRYTSIKVLPNVLCIQLKRFEFKNGHNKAASKINTDVQFPLTLNMAPYTSKYRNQDTKENIELSRQCTYDLLSVVVHVGEIETGHYISFCRVNDQWFKFNDHKVVLAKKTEVLNAQAYLLFYIVRHLI
jgi:ubiquitin carboxyl-terminal hydrolase 22/27/51